MKFLSEIQYKAEEHKRQATTSQEVTTYQLSEASQSTAGWEYVLTIPETEPISIPVVQPQQTTTGQSYRVCESTATIGASIIVNTACYFLCSCGQMIFNPPSVAPSQQEKSQHNTSELSSLF